MQGYKCVSHGTIMYIVFQKLRYVNLPCLFTVVLCACLGETTIPSVSWAWGACGISYTLLLIRKRTITTLLHWAAKKGGRNSMSKLDHEMFREYFGGNLWRSDFIRIRSGFCQSDPIRSGPGFVNAPILGDILRATILPFSSIILPISSVKYFYSW